MVPEFYEYTEKEHPYETCLHCEHRCVAFHLVAGTSFCRLHRARTQSSSFHTCSSFKPDHRAKPDWTQSIGKVFKLPLMETVPEIQTLSTEGFCPTCRHHEMGGSIHYCGRYFEELQETDRTCKQCQVGIWGKCKFYEAYIPAVTGAPPQTEHGGLKVEGKVVSLNMDTGNIEIVSDSQEES
ncbi:MAG: hypothetical protein MJ182_02860 [Treponema sp.]|nr:hypothetical protein [Treponema sp.]